MRRLDDPLAPQTLNFVLAEVERLLVHLVVVLAELRGSSSELPGAFGKPEGRSEVSDWFFDTRVLNVHEEATIYELRRGGHVFGGVSWNGENLLFAVEGHLEQLAARVVGEELDHEVFEPLSFDGVLADQCSIEPARIEPFPESTLGHQFLYGFHAGARRGGYEEYVSVFARKHRSDLSPASLEHVASVQHLAEDVVCRYRVARAKGHRPLVALAANIAADQ